MRLIKTAKAPETEFIKQLIEVRTKINQMRDRYTFGDREVIEKMTEEQKARVQKRWEALGKKEDKVSKSIQDMYRLIRARMNEIYRMSYRDVPEEKLDQLEKEFQNLKRRARRIEKLRLKV
jgi:hypothetical protein